MLNEHFIPFDILSHSKVLDVDMLTFASTFIILKEEYGRTMSQKILIGLAIESIIRTLYASVRTPPREIRIRLDLGLLCL
jgi:hypothetical protein